MTNFDSNKKFAGEDLAALERKLRYFNAESVG